MSDVDIAAIAADLHRAALAATPVWVEHSIASVVGAQRLTYPDDFGHTFADVQQRALAFIDSRLGELLATDIDRQRTTPLSIFRDAVRFPSEALHGLGARPIVRSDMSRWAFPNDPYELSPIQLADIDEDLHRTGIMWGAAKAAVHLQRRRDEGLR